MQQRHCHAGMQARMADSLATSVPESLSCFTAQGACFALRFTAWPGLLAVFHRNGLNRGAHACAYASYGHAAETNVEAAACLRLVASGAAGFYA